MRHFLRFPLGEWRRPPAAVRLGRVAAILVGGLILTPLVNLLPMLGYDWHRLFYLGVLQPYPPWMLPLFAPFRLLPWRWGLAFSNSLLMVSIAFTTALQARRLRRGGIPAAALALLTPIVLWVLWDGQIEGFVLVGMISLPWTIPVVLLRPQIAGWLLLTRRRWFVASVLWTALSIALWGPWFRETLLHLRSCLEHPTAIGWLNLGWPILLLGLAMLIGARGDFWRSLAGALVAAPYLQPYHLVLLLPALGRLEGRRRWIAWGWAWVAGLVPAFLGLTRYLALGFPIVVWLFLKPTRRSPDRHSVGGPDLWPVYADGVDTAGAGSVGDDDPHSKPSGGFALWGDLAACAPGLGRAPMTGIHP